MLLLSAFCNCAAAADHHIADTAVNVDFDKNAIMIAVATLVVESRPVRI